MSQSLTAVTVETWEKIKLYVAAKFKTKKSLKDAVKAGEEVYAVSNSMHPESGTGNATLFMPVDYHRWYAQVELVDWQIVKVK